MELCSLHYERWVRSGRLEVDSSPKKTRKAAGEICSLADCGRPVRCIGLCGSHYDKFIHSDVCPDCGETKMKSSARCKECTYKASFHRDAEKLCRGCNEVKLVEEFGWRKDGRGATKVRSRCRKCESKASRSLPSRTSEQAKVRTAAAASRLRDLKVADPDAWLRKSFRNSAKHLKLDPIEVLDRYDEVGNCCEVCGYSPDIQTESRVHIDHDHDTGKFRGFLCSDHNTLLGYLETRKVNLEGLLAYQQKHSA